MFNDDMHIRRIATMVYPTPSRVDLTTVEIDKATMDPTYDHAGRHSFVDLGGVVDHLKDMMREL
jgi:hypothetical protein